MINAVFPFVDEGFLMRSIHVKIDVRRGQVLPVAVIWVKADHENLSLIYNDSIDYKKDATCIKFMVLVIKR